MIAIKINGVEYTNIASCVPKVEYEYYYDVQTMDGKRHRDVKGKRTNYDITFYNKDFSEYDNLKSMLSSLKTVVLEVPNSTNKTIIGEYYVEISGDTLKGKLNDSDYYNTGLSVSFERVGFDE